MDVERRGRIRGLTEEVLQGPQDEGANAPASMIAAPVLENTSLQVLTEVDPAATAAEAGVKFLKSGRVPKEVEKTVIISGPILDFNPEQ